MIKGAGSLLLGYPREYGNIGIKRERVGIVRPDSVARAAVRSASDGLLESSFSSLIVEVK